MQNVKRYRYLVKTLRENKILAANVKTVQQLPKDCNVSNEVYNLNLSLNIHLFIMGNYSDLMNIPIK